MRHYCKTKSAVILLAAPNENGVYLFRTGENEDFPGLHFEPKPLLGVHAQIVEKIKTVIPEDKVRAQITICHQFFETLEGYDQDSISLYLAKIELGLEVEQDWQPLPNLIRKMPKNKNRIKYLQAMQWLAGMADVTIKVTGKNDLNH